MDSKRSMLARYRSAKPHFPGFKKSLGEQLNRADQVGTISETKAFKIPAFTFSVLAVSRAYFVPVLFFLPTARMTRIVLPSHLPAFWKEWNEGTLSEWTLLRPFLSNNF